MFKFTIRELLLLTVIVGMGIGWWAERRNAQRRIEAIREWAGVTGASEFPSELFEDVPKKQYEGLKILKRRQ